MKRWPHLPDTLSRGDLENDRMRQLYRTTVDASVCLSDEQLSESLNATLAAKPKGAGWWVFAYGSLLWNPLFPVAEMRPAMLRGLHRRFCLWSLASRGTLDCPGLVLGLDRGGACRGVALRLPAMLAIDELHLLWRREMVVGSYHPRWVKVERRRTRGRRADLRRPARSPAVRRTNVARKRKPTCSATRAAPSARRSTTSSGRASRSSRTASSTRTSNGWRRRSRPESWPVRL